MSTTNTLQEKLSKALEGYDLVKKDASTSKQEKYEKISSEILDSLDCSIRLFVKNDPECTQVFVPLCGITNTIAEALEALEACGITGFDANLSNGFGLVYYLPKNKN